MPVWLWGEKKGMGLVKSRPLISCLVFLGRLPGGHKPGPQLGQLCAKGPAGDADQDRLSLLKRDS